MSRDLSKPSRPFLPTYLIYALIAAVVAILPLLLWRWNPVFIRSTYGEAYEPFELFGFCAAAAVLGRTIWALRKEQSFTWTNLLPVLIPAGLLLHYLSLITEYSFPAWDYNCYVTAAEALSAGVDPYLGCYLYPPLLAQLFAAVQQTVLSITFISKNDVETSWNIVFYLFQCAQFFAIALAYPLLYRFARRLGFQKVTAVLFIAALLLFNTPLLRTLRHTQVNLFVLDLFLLALLLADRLPLLGGFSAAIGVHLKLYPAVLFLPWLLTKKWRPVIFTLAGLALIVLFSAGWGRNWDVWEQFLSTGGNFPSGNQFRDNSLYSLFFNGFALIAVPAGMTGSTVRTVVSIAVIGLSLFFIGWVGLRLVRRQRLLSTAGEQTAFSAEMHYFSQAMDSLALGLMLAPRVWEHHYVLATPIVLWSAAVAGRKRPLLVGTAAVLMLALPVFDIYPLSYHRLAALLLILYLTSPDKNN